MFEFVMVVAIVCGIWFYFKSGEDETVAEEPVVEASKDEAEVLDVEEPVIDEVAVVAENNEVTEEVAVEEEVVEAPAAEAQPVVEPVKSQFVAGMPEDSTLKRHYVQLVVANQAASNRIPEDAVLRRHFVQNLIANEEALLAGAPSESTLRRHYETQVSASVLAKLEILK